MEGHDIGGMGLVEWSLAPIEKVGIQIDAPGDEVVGIGTSLRIVFNRLGRQENIIVDHEGAMVHLDEQIVGGVVMAEVVGDPRPLGHPVQPDSAAGPVDVVTADRGIDGSVEFDAGHLGTREELPDMNVMNDVAGDGAERRTQTSHDACLLAVGDMVVAYHVMTYGLLVPTILQTAFDGPDIARSRS